MIAKITKGKKAAGAIRYDFGPGRRDEHSNARVLAGSVPGTPQQVARLIDHHTRPSGIKTPIWRASLSLPDEDGVLTDEKFAAIATAYVERMGYGGCPWVVVRHGDDHVHITVSRVGWDRKVVDDHGDYLKSMPIVRALEKQHGLVDAGALSNRRAPQVSGQERAASQRRGAVEPERLVIRAAVAEAVAAAAGRGRPAFEAELRQRGVDFRANEASTGRMNGYSFSIPAWTDAEGGQVWVTASKTAKDFAWQKLSPVLEPKAVPVEAAGPDLAALRLAEARERAADPRTEVVRTLRTLPAGTVPDLVSALRTLRTTLDTREGTLAAETATAMRLDGLVSGVGMGPRRGELHRRRIGLQAAVAAEAEADAQATAAGQHHQEAAAAREVEAESKAGTASRWPGRARKAAEAAATAAALAARAEAEAARLEALAARALERAAEAAPDVRGRYDEALTALEGGGWQQAERAAIGEDARNARLQQIDHQPPLQAAREAVAQARRGVEQLLAEQARRAALPPEQLRLEDQVRADLAREVTARAARAGSTTARPKKAAPKKAGPAQQPPHLRRGTDPRGRGSTPGR
ncbi:relaxase/mobilization nuclease domain-containing protein [Kitasatospora sp. NPDC048298]|uniref:relaxase/mobilization nuclease domain-containing protein n=1 Tax=Kitasatospora sp. NPDC048298 TaxID=3364049 RepID=UPI00371DA3EF